jgi:hypothetical protein
MGACKRLAHSISIGFVLRGGWQEKIVFAPSFIAIGTALLLIGSECTLPPVLRFLSGGAPLLSSFGRRSYEIYLFHLVVIEFMWIVSADLKVNLAVYSPFWLFAFLCVAYGVAYSIFRFWSEPMNHLIRQLLKRSAPPQAAAGAGEQWDEAGVAQPRNEPGLDQRGLAGAGPAEENRERLVHHALKQVADLTRNPTAQLAERQTPGPG